MTIPPRGFTFLRFSGGLVDFGVCKESIFFKANFLKLARENDVDEPWVTRCISVGFSSETKKDSIFPFFPLIVTDSVVSVAGVLILFEDKESSNEESSSNISASSFPSWLSTTSLSISSAEISGFPSSTHLSYLILRLILNRCSGYWVLSTGKIPHLLNPFLIFSTEKAFSHTSGSHKWVANSALDKRDRITLSRLNKISPQYPLSDLNTETSKGCSRSVVWGGSLIMVTFWARASSSVPYQIWERWPS